MTKMGKYEIRWCRIWEFLESAEAETEEEAIKKIQEERATVGSTVEIISVIPIDIEEVKQKGKKERYTQPGIKKGGLEKVQGGTTPLGTKKIVQKSKEKK